MATIKANGGAASVWERHTGPRVVLCRNGKVLTAIGPRLGSAVAALSGTAKKTACRAVALCNGYPVVKARRITLSMIAAAHRELETIREL